MAYGYTKKRKLSFGNRVAYQYKLIDVATTGSKLYTPFKKITGYIIETTNPATSTIRVVANTDSTGVHGKCEASLTFAAEATSQGDIIVVGLL